MKQRRGIVKRVNWPLVAVPLVFWALSQLTAQAQQGRHRENVQPGPVESLERLVVCRDGAIYRGELLEYEPRDHITLRLAGGKLKRIEWPNVKTTSIVYPPGGPTQIASVEEPPSEQPAVVVPSSKTLDRPLQPPPRFATNADPPRKADRAPDFLPLPPDLEPYRKQVANLHVSSNYPEVDVEFLKSSIEINTWATWVPVSAELWSVACEAPCGVPVNKKAIFRVVGDDMVKSREFTLPKQGQDFTLFVNGGSKSVRGGAWALLVVGLIGVNVGAAMASLGYIENSNLTPNPDVALAGWGVLAGGTALALLSIPLFVASRTKISVRSNDETREAVPVRIARDPEPDSEATGSTVD